MNADPSVTTTPTSARFLSYSAPAVRWGWPDVFAGFAVFFLALALGLLAVFTLQLDERSADAFGLISSLVTYGALIGVVVFASRRRGLGSLAADFGMQFRRIDLPLGLAAGLVVKIFSFVLAAVAVTLTDHTPEQGNFVLSPDPLWMVINGFIVASLLAPFVEELFFRGLVLRAARNRVLRRGGSPVRAAVIAIAASSVLFAALHLIQSTDVTLLTILGGSTLALGVVNSVLAIATGRIAAPIIAHVFYNGTSILLALLVGGVA